MANVLHTRYAGARTGLFLLTSVVAELIIAELDYHRTNFLGVVAQMVKLLDSQVDSTTAGRDVIYKAYGTVYLQYTYSSILTGIFVRFVELLNSEDPISAILAWKKNTYCKNTVKVKIPYPKRRAWDRDRSDD